jgi:hypothetical protein
MRLARTSSPWQRFGHPEMARITLQNLTGPCGDTAPSLPPDSEGAG